jgi:putative CocE/NonD family hydrolase
MFDVRIEGDVPATMRDGTVLRADVFRPASEGPFPVLLCRLPYGKRVPLVLQQLDALTLARNGFIVVVQDVRGRFASEGVWEPWTNEEQDGYDSIQWAAGLAGSNGSVGMIGPSYNGNTQWMAAVGRPPALKAIAPRVTWAEPHNGLFSRGGAYEYGLGLWWSLVQGLETVGKRSYADPTDAGNAVTSLVHDLDSLDSDTYWEEPSQRHPALARHGLHDLGFEHASRDPAWAASCRVAQRHADVEVPSLNVAGWYDCFSQGTLDNFVAMTELGRPANLIVGPWHHHGAFSQVGDVNFGLAASGDLLDYRGSLTQIEMDWFRQHMLPSQNETADHRPLPPVLLFVMGINEWREEDEWPLSKAVDTTWFLRSDGGLSMNQPAEEDAHDAYVYDHSDPVPTLGGAALLSSEYPLGPVDQSSIEMRSDVLLYTSEPLESDTEVTGRVHAVIHAASVAASADWVVRLCDVSPEGRSLNVVDGIVRSDMTPGVFSEHHIDLWSTSHVFRRGHRIRVQVTSSCFPRWDRNPNGHAPASGPGSSQAATQQIARSATRASHVVLPVVSGQTG